MQTAIKRRRGFLLSCAALAACTASASEQHGEVVCWQAATHGMPTELRWNHQASGVIAEQIEWLVEPELRWTQPQSSRAGVGWQNPDQAALVSLQRTYLGYRSDEWQVRVGRQTFDWSQTDTISPADLLSPRDWSDITRVRKLAAPAVSLRKQGSTSLELVWLPRQQSAWLPQGDWMPATAAALLSAEQQHDENSQWAVRASGNLLQTDWNAVYYKGHSIAPSLALASGPSLQPYYQPLRASAITLARQVNESQIARLEVAHYRQPDTRFVQYVASLDRETGDWLATGDTLYTIIQYAGSTQRAAAVDLLGWPDFRCVLEHSVMFKASYDRHSDQRSVIELSAVKNTLTHDSYWRLGWQQRLGSALTLNLAVITMHGDEHTFWGTYRGNDRATVQLSWKY